MLTWQMWIKVMIACVPAAVVGLLFNDYLDAVFSMHQLRLVDLQLYQEEIFLL